MLDEEDRKTGRKPRRLPVEVTPSVDPTTGYDMTDEEAAFRASDDDPEALGPAPMRSSERIGGSRPYGSKGGSLPKGAGDAETVGEAIERSRERAAPVPMDDETTAAIDAMDDGFDTPDERAELAASTPMGTAGTAHHRADGSVERTPPSPAAPDREYLLEAFGGNEVDDVPQDWGRDETGAMFARGGLGFDYDRTPTTMQGLDDAERVADGGQPNGAPADMTFTEAELYPADDNEAVEAANGIDDDEAAEVYPVGEDFSDPETDAGMPAEPPPEDMTDFDAIAALDGRVMEDATVEGEPGIPGYDDLDAADMGIAADDLAMERAGVSPDAESIPGYPEDDNEDVEAAMGIDDDEAAEMGGMELASPAAPRTSIKTPDAGDPAMRLDAGLPTEGEIGGATALDVLRFPLHALGAGFSAAAGRSSSPFRSIAGPMREARSEGIEGRLDAKGETAIADRAADRESADAEAGRASAERLASIRNEPTDLERSREARLAADAERASSLTSRRLDLTERGIAGEESESARTAAESEARRDYRSPQSDAARRRLRAQLDALASSPRTRPIAEALGSGLDTMSADDVERIERGSMLRPLMGRGGGVGGGGGGGGSDALTQQYMASGMSEEAARARVAALGTTGARAELRTMATEERRGTEDASGGEEILPGVRAGIDLSTGEARAMRNRASTYRDGYVALGEVESILDRYGAETVINPEIQAELQPAMVSLMAMVAQIQNTGVINPSERPLIEATLPDPSSLTGMTLGRVAGALRGWRRRLEGATSSLMETAGVDDGGIESGMTWLRSGRRARGTSRGPASSGPTVRVRDADGRVSSVPAEAWAELPEEERAGYEVVE